MSDDLVKLLTEGQSYCGMCGAMAVERNSRDQYICTACLYEVRPNYGTALRWEAAARIEALTAENAKLREAAEWQPIETAPKDRDILVWYDHDADPYQDPDNLDHLTDYAALCEGGEFLSGSGMTVAKWHDRQWEAQDEYGGGFWLPAGWFSRGDHEYYEVVCNPTHWKPVEPPK